MLGVHLLDGSAEVVERARELEFSIRVGGVAFVPVPVVLSQIRVGMSVIVSEQARAVPRIVPVETVFHPTGGVGRFYGERGTDGPVLELPLQWAERCSPSAKWSITSE